MDGRDLQFTLLNASGFKRRGLSSLDPYIVIKSQGQNLRSITLKGVSNQADWTQVNGSSGFQNEHTLYNIRDNSLIVFELYDENILFRNKYMGTATKPLHELLKAKSGVQEITFTKQGKEDKRGTLQFRFTASLPVAQPALQGKKFRLAVTPGSAGLWIFGETEPLQNKYQLISKLGEGAFGITKKAKHKVTGEEFACKSIAKSKLTTPEAIGDVKREIEVMYHLSGHPNVVKLEEVFEDATHVHIVMELCRGGNLYQHIISRGNYTEGDIAQLMQTIMSVVAHCHEMNVLHRDLKPENFLLADPYEQGKPLVLKATDFGLSTFARVGQTFAEVVGTCYYIAPEVLRREGGQEADIWSAGIIMYILLSGRPPFGGADETQVFKNIMNNSLDLRGRLWDLVSKQGKTLLRSMLDKNPAKRPLAKDILGNIWFKAEGAWQCKMDPELFTRMKVFAEANLLKKLTLFWLAGDVSRVEVAGLEAMFADIDENGDRVLDETELKAALHRRGGSLTVEQVMELVDNIDLDSDGKVNKQEFIAAALSLKRIDSNKIRQAFDHFDGDNDQHLNPEELKAALKRASSDGERDVQVILDQADVDGDGLVSFSEFKNVVRSIGSARSSDAVTSTQSAPAGSVTFTKSAPP